MENNTFSATLRKNNRNIVMVLAYAVLEWILILLLLINSLFSCFISKFARYFGLEPSCTLCVRLNHVLESDENNASSLGHVCETHGSEISGLSYCTTHQRLANSMNLCGSCSLFNQVHVEKRDEISQLVSYLTGVCESEALIGEENTRCSCCDEMLLRRNLNPPPLMFKPWWDVLDYIKKSASTEEDNGDQASETTSQSKSSASLREESDCLNRDDESLYIAHMILQNAGSADQSDGFICIEMTDTDSTNSENPLMNSSAYSVEECSSLVEEAKDEPNACLEDDRATHRIHEVTDDYQGTEESLNEDVISEMELLDDDSVSKEQLKAKIKSQQKALDALYVELDEERKASAVSASETMAMITKLQEEKSAMQIEALQYQRMMEEQAEYDQEALQLLNDLVVKREKEKQELEKELEIYRNKVSELEATENMIMVGIGNDNDDHDENRSIDFDSEGELDDKSLELDFHMQQIMKSPVSDISLAEFDGERLSILEDLKILEAKLFELNDGEAGKDSYINVLDCPCDSFDGFDQKTSADTTAKKLLPFFDAANKDDELEIENQLLDQRKLCLHEQFSVVYERLQALEADKEFFKHCIRSIMKGDKGMVLLQEILQHLRDLRSVEFSDTT